MFSGIVDFPASELHLHSSPSAIMQSYNQVCFQVVLIAVMKDITTKHLSIYP